MGSTNVQVTAGLGGFLVLFLVGLAVWFLARDMTRRLRRMRRREKARLAEEERLAQTGTQDEGPQPPRQPPPGDPGEGPQTHIRE